MGLLVFISVLLVAACGLIYELVAGTLASYLSLLQTSTATSPTMPSYRER